MLEAKEVYLTENSPAMLAVSEARIAQWNPMQASNHSKRRGMLWLTKLISLRVSRQCKRGLHHVPAKMQASNSNHTREEMAGA